ncbi:hypothetical protein PsorP6_005506 [Peronosclerospora sorghi]|uniref:Uncharacterized protein n=1 Tax=Peronosclerospora sorghi TaxID=230839 RepID=A0ACC0W865_9STRA|nr:hypothetical protein PsorP6_005506 [Peronosclerospora sorghi]
MTTSASLRRLYTSGLGELLEEWNNFYEVRVQNVKQFDLAIGFIGNGASFRKAAPFIQLTKEKTGLASLGSVDRAETAKYARTAVALKLQKVSDILESVGAFHWLLILPQTRSQPI